MNNSQSAPSRSNTVNGARYGRGRSNSIVRLNPDGLPVALRRVVALGQPGSFACDRYQLVTPRGVTDVPASRARRMVEHTAPLN
jgi:hypothetical protein